MCCKIRLRAFTARLRQRGQGMRDRLTQTMIERAKPKARPYLIHDTGVPGLCVRIQPSGVKSFLLRWGRSGITTFKPRFPSLQLDAARELAKKKIGEIAEQG